MYAFFLFISFVAYCLLFFAFGYTFALKSFKWFSILVPMMFVLNYVTEAIGDFDCHGKYALLAAILAAFTAYGCVVFGYNKGKKYLKR